MTKRFTEVKIIKPDSSRAQSFEIFLVGRGFV
jgi:23S rRNA U2552 (ribose-2'-O)-methylase RlmE/FtsJ